MERQEALKRLEAAFPEDEGSITLEGERIWFMVYQANNDLRPRRVGVAVPSYDKADQAIGVLRKMLLGDADS